MANRVIKETFTNHKEILKYNEFIACPVTVSDAGVVADADGKKIVKAGTIIGGATQSVLLNPGEVVVDKLVPGVKATKTFGLTTAGIVVTAKVEGDAGEAITVALVDPGVAGNLGVVVTGTDIVVNLKYADAAIVSTAAEVAAAIMANAAAAALVTAVPLTTGEGVMVAVAETALANGADVTAAATAEGVLLYDVDVTNGPREGSMVIWGFVDLAKVANIGAAVVAALPKITFLY